VKYLLFKQKKHADDLNAGRVAAKRSLRYDNFTFFTTKTANIDGFLALSHFSGT
jgi:hypothetical protein